MLGIPVTATEGKKTNPASTTLLADTDAIAEFSPNADVTHVALSVVIWAETGVAAASTAIIEHRNAANSANIRTVEVNYVSGGEIIIPYSASLANNERVRVIQGATAPGTGIDVQVLITGEKVAP